MRWLDPVFVGLSVVGYFGAIPVIMFSGKVDEAAVAEAE